MKISSISNFFKNEKKELKKFEKFYNEKVKSQITTILNGFLVKPNLFIEEMTEEKLKIALSAHYFTKLGKKCPIVPPKPRRIVTSSNHSEYVLWIPTKEYANPKKGTLKKGIYASELHTGKISFALSMPLDDHRSKRQREITNVLKLPSLTKPALKKFIVWDSDQVEYTNKKQIKKIVLFQEEMVGNLKKGINSSEFTAQNAFEIFSGLLEGFAQLHEQGIILRDVKPDNILWTRSKDGLIEVKVNDFDLACNKHLDSQEYLLKPAGNFTYSCYDYLLNTKKMADQLDKQDVWAVGMILYKLYMNQDVAWVAKTRVADKLLQEQLKASFIPDNIKNQNKTEFAKEFVRIMKEESADIDSWFDKELKENLLGKLIYKMLTSSYLPRPFMAEILEEFQELIKDQKTVDGLKQLYDARHQMPKEIISSKEEVE